MNKIKIFLSLFLIFILFLNVNANNTNEIIFNEPISLNELETIIETNKKSMLYRSSDNKEIIGILFKNWEFSWGIDFLNNEISNLTSKEIIKNISERNSEMTEKQIESISEINPNSEIIKSLSESKKEEIKITWLKFKETEKLNKNRSSNFSNKANSWEPAYWTSKVDQNGTTQTFYFDDVSYFWKTSTYEHETHIYNRNYATYWWEWKSNLPSAYLDNNWFDWDTFLPTIWTSKAIDLEKNKEYSTYIKFNKWTDKNARIMVKWQIWNRIPGFCHSPNFCIWAEATSKYFVEWRNEIWMSWINTTWRR